MERTNVGNYSFLHPLLCYVMTCNEHDMLTMFLKLKPLVVLGSKSEYAYDFIFDYYYRLHKLGMFHHRGLRFVSFQVQCEARSGGELIWSADIEFYLHSLGPSFMLCC